MAMAKPRRAGVWEAVQLEEGSLMWAHKDWSTSGPPAVVHRWHPKSLQCKQPGVWLLSRSQFCVRGPRIW